MKKVAAALLLMVLAACAGPARYTGSQYPSSPSVPPPGEMRPYAVPPEARQPQSSQMQGPAAIHAPAKVPSAGPLKTAMIGSYMDNQERDLRQHLRGLVGVGRPGDDIVLNLRNDQLFDGNASRLSQPGADALTRIAVILRHYDHTQIQVSGFTDTTGTPDQNRAASEKRAHTVCDALAEAGVPRARLSCQGLGETRLRIATGDHKNEPRNRRIEIRITASASG
jgi:outer membrane protein OmpA-like peptidoglycan-associated protein